MHRLTGLHGLGEANPAAQPAQPHEEYGELVYNVALAGGGSVADDMLQNDRSDAEFQVLGIKGASTGTYTIRMKDSNGRHIQSAPVQNTLFVGTAQFPTPIVPGITIPPAGRVGFDLVDTSGVANTIQLVLIGVRRYATR